jgi:hypothetical protein
MKLKRGILRRITMMMREAMKTRVHLIKLLSLSKGSMRVFSKKSLNLLKE